jgi:hypothetical protein
MTEQANEFEWRREGEEAEIIVNAPDSSIVETAMQKAAPFATLPGITNPVHAAASPESFGCVVASETHASATLFSAPERSVLLVVDASGPSRPSPGELKGIAMRALSDSRTTAPSEGYVRRLCEEGAQAAAEEGLMGEEDLIFFPPAAGDADALGRGALGAGVRGWRELPGRVDALVVSEVLDSDGLDELGLEPGSLAMVVRSGAGELGRLAISSHRDRIQSRAGEFGMERGPVAAPLDSEEALDLISAANAAANFADGRMATTLHAIQHSVTEAVGEPRIRASWRVGGIQEDGGVATHRAGLASVAEGRAVVSGGVLGCGTGNMYRSAPPFGVMESDGRHAWEEAGLLVRWARLEMFEDRG